MKKVTTIRYLCETCGREYKKPEDAMKCEAVKETPVVKVGDIVTLKNGFGWYDGDDRWVINPEREGKKTKHKDNRNCFDSCCTMGFYYVVTAITPDPRDKHRLQYHCFTNAMTGKNGYHEGYTYVGTHYTPKKVTRPPRFVVKDSQKLIGKLSEYLL